MHVDIVLKVTEDNTGKKIDKAGRSGDGWQLPFANLCTTVPYF
jgi:hypothetical protein